MAADLYASIIELDRGMPWVKSVAAVILGMIVGSFLNVLALRSIDENASILHPRSHCPTCKHRLKAFDLVPVLSYFLLRGRCRYCSTRIAWYYPFVEAATGVTFFLVLLKFGWTMTGLGMLFFASTLIAVTITDFKAMLIPHEITYPAILIGLLFTATVSRGIIPPDTSPLPPLYSALSGVGISYILFDFLAFYGLKAYTRFHRSAADEDGLEDGGYELGADTGTGSGAGSGLGRNPNPNPNPNPNSSASADTGTVAATASEGEPGAARGLGAGQSQTASLFQSSAAEEIDDQLDGVFEISEQPQLEEEMEVMGGGDAVLAALIAAWLGLDNLFISLIVGFVFGAIMGGLYVGRAMYDDGCLDKAVKPVTVAVSLSVGVVGSFMLILYNLSPGNALSPAYIATFLIFASLLGGVLGVVKAGRGYSRPFPFGPALVAGACVSMCLANSPI